MKLSTVDMDLDERKADLIYHMFIDPADSNYLTARWAYHNGLFHQFYWDAAQSLEKFMKAALLLKNAEVREYDHDLNKLFDALCAINHNNLFLGTIQLPKTAALGGESWEGQPYSLFIDYIDRFGSADNRYGNIGTFVNGPVIHILDECCCSLRKFIRQNNFFDDDLHRFNNEKQYWHDKVSNPLDWMISPDFLLERLYRGSYQVGQSANLRRVFSNMNLSFFPEPEEDEATFGGIHIMGSPVHHHLVRLFEQNDGIQKYMSEDQKTLNRTIIPQLKEWARRSIRFSKRIRSELKL